MDRRHILSLSMLIIILSIVSVEALESNASTTHSFIQKELSSLSLEKERIESKGYTTIRLSIYLDNAESYLSKGDINQSMEYLNESRRIISLIKDIDNQKEDISIKIGSLSDDSSISIDERIFEPFDNEFRIENYEGAKQELARVEEKLKGSIEKSIEMKIESLSDASESYDTEIIRILQTQSRTVILNLDIIGYNSLAQKISFYNSQFETINHIEGLIADLESQNLSPDVFEDIKIRSLEKIDKDDVQGLIEIDKSYQVSSSYYIESREYLGLLENRINSLEEKGHDIANFEEEFLRGKREYSLGNYVLSTSIFDKVSKDIDDFESDQILKRSAIDSGLSFKEFIKLHKKTVMIFSVIALILMFLGYRTISKKILVMRYESLKRSKDMTIKMIAELQNGYYNKKNMPKDQYNKLSEEYQERLIGISKSLFILKKDKRIPGD